MPKLNIRDADRDDIPAILEIYNDAVLNTTAIWNETPSTLADRTNWLDMRRAAGYPVLVAEAEGLVVGYASFGPFRAFEGFRHSAELSIYVHPERRGKGTGAGLLEALIQRAERQDIHVLIAGIEAGNRASIILHERAGFQETGRMPQVGRKFGRWLDLVLMQRFISTDGS